MQRFLQKINYKEGEEVKEGTTLFVIEPEPYRLKLEQARAAEAGAKATLKQTELEYERQAELASLRHYLARHLGRDRDLQIAWLSTPLPRDEAWARLVGPGGFRFSPAAIRALKITLDGCAPLQNSTDGCQRDLDRPVGV